MRTNIVLHEQNPVLYVFPWARIKLLEQQGSFVKLPICSEWGMCFYSSICVCMCVGVCQYTQCTTTGPFFHLPLRGHSFFPGFHPIVFKEKGLVAHPQPPGWLHSVLIWREQQEGWGSGGGWVLVTVYYSLVEWICESACLARSAGWAAWVRAGQQIQTKTNTTAKTSTVPIILFFSSSSSTPQSRHLLLISPSSDELGMHHPCPQTQVLLGTYYPKHLLQCCVEVMCWLPYQEFS